MKTRKVIQKKRELTDVQEEFYPGEEKLITNSIAKDVNRQGIFAGVASPAQGMACKIPCPL